MIQLLNVALERQADPIGGMWAAISTAFVFRDSRQHSLAAGLSRLIATSVSFALCLSYLCLFSPTIWGMAMLLAVGTLLMMIMNRTEDVVTTGVTTIVIMVVALKTTTNAWEQPLFRLVDTVVGIAMGVAGQWMASFAYYKARGEPVR